MAQQVYSIPVDEPYKAGETHTRRSILSAPELMQIPTPGVETLYDVLNHSAETFKDRRAFGYRKLLNTFHEKKEVPKVVDGVEKKETKTWNYFELSHYEYYTYVEAVEKTRHLGAGLRQLGLHKGDKIHIFASTSVEWMLLAHGAFTQAITIVTAYDTLGADGLRHSINETGTTVCFVNGDQLPIIEKILPSCPNLKSIIYRGDPSDQTTVDRLSEKLTHLIPFERLEANGKANPVDIVKPTSADMCCIMYTSGSTGNPKGVMLTHGNVVAAVAATSLMLQHLVETNDTMMAYLPLAHVLEFLVENLCIFLGLTLGYGSIRTLTDQSVRNCQGDLQEFGPTIMTGVPQVWETIRKTILAKVALRGPRIEKIFGNALRLKAYLKGKGLPTGFLDRIVFNNVKKQLGGRLRYGLSGGAPLSCETQEFLSTCLAPIICGYGMTESCGMCALMAPEQFALGEVGSPVPCVEVKLVDVPELNYRATNPKPQGEIWIRGTSVTSGYYNRPDLTEEALTPDGWLMTGDIGEWNAAGTLTIIDRKKNLVKLSNGEYIALEKLESVYKTCLLVENICVHVDPLYPKPVALVVPVEKSLRELAAAHEIQENDWQKLCESAQVRSLVLNQLQQQARKSGLKGAEIISDVWLCKDLWTTEMGLLTAAQKLKRKEITETFSKHLQEMTTSK